MQITEALRLRGRNVTMVIVDECPTYLFLRRLVANGVEVECLAEVEDKSIAFILKRRTFAVAMMMLWFFNDRNLPERRAAAPWTGPDSGLAALRLTFAPSSGSSFRDFDRA